MLCYYCFSPCNCRSIDSVVCAVRVQLYPAGEGARPTLTAGLGGAAAGEAAGLVPHLTTRRPPLLLPRLAWRVRRLPLSGLPRAQTTSRGLRWGSLGWRYSGCGQMLELAPRTPLLGGRGAGAWSLAPLWVPVFSVPGVTSVLCSVAASSSAWALVLGLLWTALTDLPGVVQCAGDEDEISPTGGGGVGGGSVAVGGVRGADAARVGQVLPKRQVAIDMQRRLRRRIG